MEFQHWFYLFFSLLFLTKFLFGTRKHYPPSPAGSIPIVGHLRLVFTPLHRTLQTLSQRYGQYLFLRLGSRRVLVLSSPAAIEECINKNDLAFANRPRTVAGDYLSYNYTVLALSNYNQLWRNLRRITTTEIFSSASLQASSSVRRDAVRCLLRELYRTTSRSSGAGPVPGQEIKIDLKSKFFELTFNAMMSMVTGQPIGEGLLDSEDNKWFFAILKDTHVPSLFMGPGDYLQVLRWFDVFKIEKALSGVSKKRDVFLDEMIDKYRKRKMENTSGSGNLDGGDDQKKSILDVFFSLQEKDPEQFSDVIIKGMIVTMFTAGTDTSALTLEWAMSLLLNHPEKLQKALSEIDDNVKPGHIIEDSDLAKLPYLHSIILETLRLYPPVPFLVPHESSRECQVGKYDVPKGTVLVANAWAIHRDPKVWADPSKFMPERFENGQAEREGFKFIPFGIGRRGCPGSGLATRVMALTLGSLLQCFEWEKIGDEPVDLSEGTGFTLPKAKPLEALCKPRSPMLNVLSQI